MPQNEARAWWAEVEHVRESIERRRGGAAESAAPGDRAAAGRFTRAGAPAEPPVPRLDDLDWPPELPGRGTRRFERAARPDRGAATPEDARVSRRHAAAVTDADRASARGRRARAEPDLPRTRSQRAGDGQAPVARGTRTRTSSAGAGANRTATRRGAAPDLDFERAPAPAGRRTVQITGRPAAAPSLPRLVEVERRRPGRPPAERLGPRPDRIALYAVLLGFFLILVAAASAHAAI